jgi:hypothetical protein
MDKKIRYTISFLLIFLLNDQIYLPLNLLNWTGKYWSSVVVFLGASASMFRVVDVSAFPSFRPEVLGSKAKEWLQFTENFGLGNKPYLFKVGRLGTGENWAEKVTCEIALGIELPCASYELAIRNGEKGVISEQIMPLGASLALGNLLIPQLIPGYEHTKLRRQTDYRLSGVLDVIRQIDDLQVPQGSTLDIIRPVDYFVGYLLFDVLVGNTDRHHENWGVVVERKDNLPGKVVSWLAPTFDHASSLGRAELDDKRKLRLTTTDSRADMAAYVKRAKTAFYGDEEQSKMMTSLDVLNAVILLEPESSRFWGRRICSLDRNFFEGLFNQIPADWITPVAIEFAVEMLMLNQRAISEALNG